MTTRLLRRNIKILVINPNSSLDMTRGMEKAIQGMPLHDVSWGVEAVNMPSVMA